MSNAALALLDADDEAPQESPAKRSIALLEGRVKVPQRSTPPAVRMGDIADDPDVGAAEALLKGITGAAGTAVGGVAGVGSLLLGRGAQGAEDTIEWWKQALTYEPRTAAGQGAADVGGHVMQTIGRPVQAVKDYAGESAESAGWGPLASTAMSMAPDAILALTGTPGVPKGAGASAMADARAIADATGASALAAKAAPLTDFVKYGVRPDASPLAETNPFARESLGAAAAAPDLRAASPELQAEVTRAVNAGEKIDRVALDRRLEAESLPVPIRLTKGQASQNVEQISHEMNRRGRDPELAQTFAEQNQALIDNLDEIRASAAPNAVGFDHIQNGQALIDHYKAFDEVARTEINAAYKAARDANGGELPMDAPAFTAAADQTLKKNMKARYLPGEIAADLAEFRESGTMTFEQFENLRTNLAAEARKAERAGDGNAAAAVNIVRDALESIEPVGEAAQVKPLFDTARSLAKARFDRLKTDPAYRAATDDAVGVGEASPLADDFVNKFVVKGKAANIARMREHLAGQEGAAENIAAGALNYVKSKSGVNLYTNEGNFSQAGFNRALSELTPKLDVLVDPKVAEQIQTLGNVARYTQAQPRGSFVNNSNTTVAAHAAALAKGAAERSVNALLPGAELGTLAREKLAKRAEKKFVREALDPASGITKKGEK